MEELFWQLLYPNGRVEFEPPTHTSIMSAPLGAFELRLATREGKPAYRIDLEKKPPIFYRIRSLGLSDKNGTRLDAIVFGTAWETDTTIETKLWALMDGQVINCPDPLCDQTMIKLQVTRH